MTKHKDIVGMRFGRLVVMSNAETKPYRSWLCKCDCGNLKIVATGNLFNNSTKSCGCLYDEMRHKANRIHGLSKHPLYKKWNHIKDRCYYPGCDSYKLYGQKGIGMCDEWKNDFMSFYNWSISHGWREDLTIDRIDSTKGYSPENCRWVDWKVQENNRSDNTFVEYMGKRQTLSQWAREYNLEPDTLINRYYHRTKWDFGKMLTTPIKDHFNKTEINGELLTLREIADKYNIDMYLVQLRFHRGDRGKRLIREPGSEHISKDINYAEINGEMLTFREISKKYGVNQGTVASRYRRGKRGLDLIKIRTRKG